MAFKHIVVATDFGDSSRLAVDQAIDIALRYDAALTVVHVFEVPYGYADAASGELVLALQGEAETGMAKALAAVRAKVPNATGVIRSGSPWEQILDVAKGKGADLIVVGSRGRRGFTRALLGSVAEKVVRLGTVPVLTVHGGTPGRTS